MGASRSGDIKQRRQPLAFRVTRAKRFCQTTPAAYTFVTALPFGVFRSGADGRQRSSCVYDASDLPRLARAWISLARQLPRFKSGQYGLRETSNHLNSESRNCGQFNVVPPDQSARGADPYQPTDVAGCLLARNRMSGSCTLEPLTAL
jgi:hypothetical protein